MSDDIDDDIDNALLRRLKADAWQPLFAFYDAILMDTFGAEQDANGDEVTAMFAGEFVERHIADGVTKLKRAYRRRLAAQGKHLRPVE
jgi:hypothetical protein